MRTDWPDGQLLTFLHVVEVTDHVGSGRSCSIRTSAPRYCRGLQWSSRASSVARRSNPSRAHSRRGNGSRWSAPWLLFAALVNVGGITAREHRRPGELGVRHAVVEQHPIRTSHATASRLPSRASASQPLAAQKLRARYARAGTLC